MASRIANDRGLYTCAVNESIPMVKIDMAFIEEGWNNGTINRVQSLCLGLPWPLESGWRQKVWGREITEEAAEFYLSLRGKRLKGRAKREALQKARELSGWMAEDLPDYPKPKPAPQSHKQARKERKAKKPSNILRPDYKFAGPHNVGQFFVMDGEKKIDVSSNAFLSTFAWRSLRMEALRKHGGRCQCCGASAATGATIHVDHIKPRKLHPELALTLDNLQILCVACNHGKGNWDQTDWRPAP